MTSHFMRMVDLWCGEPIVRLLIALDSLRGRSRRDKPDRPVTRIVVAKFFGLGSIVLTTPLLRAVRAQHPGADVAFLSFAQNAGMLTMLPEKVRPITIRTTGFATFVWDVLRALVVLRRFGPDVFLDLEFYSRFSAILAFLSGARIRAGFHHARLTRGRLLTARVRLTTGQHIARAFLSVGDALVPTARQQDVSVRLMVQDADRRRVAALAPTRPYVVFNPCVSDLKGDYGRWDPAKWALLARRFAAAHPGVEIAIVGAPQDRQHVAQIVDRVGHGFGVLNLAGRTNLGELVALIQGAAVVVTTDSGPLHMAAAVGTPTVALFGPETPVHYGHAAPWHQVVYKGLPCSPCLELEDGKRIRCPYDARCMREISTEEVLVQLTALWTRRAVMGNRPDTGVERSGERVAGDRAG